MPPGTLHLRVRIEDLRGFFDRAKESELRGRTNVVIDGLEATT
jgi:hypothetical protein